MTYITLKQRLERYLRTHPGWIASGNLQRIAAEKTKYTPSNVSRRLRELENEKTLEVKYVKGHAHYRAPQKLTPEAAEELAERTWALL